MHLKKRIALLGVTMVIIVAGVLFATNFIRMQRAGVAVELEKARSVLSVTEATRSELNRAWEQGVFTTKQFREWAENGDTAKVQAVEPVVAACRAARQQGDENGYDMRVTKFSPRNPQNAPDNLEARALRHLERENLAEYYEFDKPRNAIRYFRPIRLSAECLNCHGDSGRALALWGSSKGLDPTGAQMENGRAGDMFGAFEIIQSLDEMDRRVAGVLWSDAALFGMLVLACGAAFYWLTGRGIERLYRPIRNIAHALSHGADQVANASEQIASVADQLAHSASTQAASLQETSSSLEEMSAMTRATAENAGQANDSAARAKVGADRGDATVHQLHEAMNALNQSSGEISKIIKSIESIAFQTNLLALNAAVEAARAGEHGKGFAVVADEVRNLAQRSAEAARDTTRLVESSIERAHGGGNAAQNAAEALKAIVGDVVNVAALLSDISRAAEEQARGVAQISTAVTQLDRVTQQNAATAEESASASAELRAQSAAVRELVAELLQLIGTDFGNTKAADRLRRGGWNSGAAEHWHGGATGSGRPAQHAAGKANTGQSPGNTDNVDEADFDPQSF